MPSLPILSGREVVRAFGTVGWQMVRQRGSHMATLCIPDHKEVARGTLRSLIRASGLTLEEFINLARA